MVIDDNRDNIADTNEVYCENELISGTVGHRYIGISVADLIDEYIEEYEMLWLFPEESGCLGLTDSQWLAYRTGYRNALESKLPTHVWSNSDYLPMTQARTPDTSFTTDGLSESALADACTYLNTQIESLKNSQDWKTYSATIITPDSVDIRYNTDLMLGLYSATAHVTISNVQLNSSSDRVLIAFAPGGIGENSQITLYTATAKAHDILLCTLPLIGQYPPIAIAEQYFTFLKEHRTNVLTEDDLAFLDTLYSLCHEATIDHLTSGARWLRDSLEWSEDELFGRFAMPAAAASWTLREKLEWAIANADYRTDYSNEFGVMDTLLSTISSRYIDGDPYSYIIVSSAAKTEDIKIWSLFPTDPTSLYGQSLNGSIPVKIRIMRHFDGEPAMGDVRTMTLLEHQQSGGGQ